MGRRSLLGRFSFLLAVLFATIFNASLANAAVIHDYSLDWYTLETKHFRCHYHNGEEKLARRSLAIAEAVHEELSLMMDWVPESKTDMILTDEYDVSNGFATPFPTNRTGIFLSGPDSVNSLEDNSDWLETVIKHEYLHILHLDKATGAASAMRSIFGRAAYIFPFFTAFPNAYQPAWIVEGLATYVETDKQRGIGRGQSSYFDMLMRMESKDNFKSLAHVNVPSVTEWPMNTSRYLYGVHFFQFLEEKYGKKKIMELVDNYSDNIIPWRLNSNARYTVGKDLYQLWDDFEIAMKEKYSPQADEVKKRGEIIGKRITKEGYFTSPLKVLENGDIYYVDYNADKNRTLKVIHPNKDGDYQQPKLVKSVEKVVNDSKDVRQKKPSGYQKPKVVAEVEFTARFDIHDTAGIVMAKPDRCRNAALYFDLFHIDLKTGSETRLTNCARYRYVTWSGNGKQMVAVKNGLAKNELHLLDGNGKYIETLWKGKESEVVSSIDWSPTENKLIASVFRTDGGWNLEMFDITTKNWSFITQDDAIETTPVFTADGKDILYSSDNGGIYNIRRLNLASAETTSLTDLIGGGFNPIQVKNDLFYVGYTSEGFDIFKLEIKETRDVPDAKKRPTGIVKKFPDEVETGPVKEYSAAESIVPRWWHPLLAITDDYYQLGAFTHGWDTLTQHIYGLSASYVDYDGDYNDWLGSVDYIYDGWFPTLKLHASHGNKLSRNSNGDIIRVRSDDVLQAEVVFPLLTLSQRASLHVAAVKNSEKDSWRKNSNVFVGADNVDNLLGAAIVYNNTSFHPKSVSRAEGRVVQFAVEDSDRIGNSDYSGKVITADWREYVRLGGSHVLALRAVKGNGDDNTRPFELGGSSNTNFEPGLLGSTVSSSPFNRRQYSLRGYAEGRSELTGRDMQLGTIEYRFPIWRLERVAMTPPIGLQNLSAAVFIDRGATWNSGGEKKYYTGTGVELYADTIFGYNTVVRITLGYAHGNDDQIGEDQFYAPIGSRF